VLIALAIVVQGTRIIPPTATNHEKQPTMRSKQASKQASKKASKQKCHHEVANKKKKKNKKKNSNISTHPFLLAATIAAL